VGIINNKKKEKPKLKTDAYENGKRHDISQMIPGPKDFSFTRPLITAMSEIHAHKI